VTSRVLRTVLLGLTLVAAALATAGCGNKPHPRLEADTEGPYVDFGPVKYQVQLSRELNPADPEDRYYLKGLAKGTARIPKDQVWFGVWMRAQNTGETPQPAAREFEITDSQDKVYRPVPLDTASNAFVYQPIKLGPGAIIPEPATPAAEGPIQGSLLLFRLDLASYQNRPLELHVRSPQDPRQQAVISLDL
jgi:hypothetical protein